jgi:hypothetical protein
VSSERNGAENDLATSRAKSELPASVRLAAVVLRSLFLIILIVMVARVASPQMAGRTWYDVPPGDLIRVGLGFGICALALVDLFILPKDPGAYRMWMNFGIVLVPVLLIFVIAIW